MKADIWMPFYIGDYLADTLGLSLPEHGAYLLLILAYWRNGGPITDAQARSIIRDLPQEQCDRLVTFFRAEEGYWHHKRIDAELAKANEFRDRQSRAGKASAAARTNHRSSTVEPPLNQCSTGVATKRQPEVNPSQSHSPSQLQSSSTPHSPPEGGALEKAWEPNAVHLRLNQLFNRKSTTAWSAKEQRALKVIGDIPDDDFTLIERYYTATIPADSDYRRRDLLTLLNNWPGELDRARKFTPASQKNRGY